MNNLRKNLSNILGWRTNRKIVVFESDDWGSVRTRSAADYKSMLNAGLNVDNTFFTKYDSLESSDDLERLFNLLTGFKDSTGRHPVFTPMCIVANPDFNRIQESGFQNYYYKTLFETTQDYPNRDKVVPLWRSGVEHRLFVPALHGREHLNVRRYMSGLRDETNEGLRIALEHESIGASKWGTSNIIEYLGALHPTEREEISELEQVLHDAVRLFIEVCGYRPTHFIGPNREPAKQLDKTLANEGVMFMTQSKLRKYPRGDGKYGFEFNWLGKQNKYKQTYIMRNSGFEPAGGVNTIDTCLMEIENAFKWNKPAVISTHRANYIGSISQANGDLGLAELEKLLKAIASKWPDVEYLTSTELGELINRKTNVQHA